MTTITPVNPKATTAAVYNPDLNVTGAPVPAGHWRFYQYWWDQDGDPTGIEYGCPCGCGALFTVPFDSEIPDEMVWNWNGETESVSVSPAIRIEQLNDNRESIGTHWHGELVDGEFRSLEAPAP